MDLAMLGLGSVAGTVLDLSGHPVSGAQVFAVSGTDPQVGGNAFTDGSGKYTINGITVGEVTVTAQKGISVGSSAGNIERAGTTAFVNVTLNGGSVQVFGTVTQVVNGVASPVPNLPVVYYSTSQPLNPIPVGVAITAANGTYSIKGMPVGPYDVLARLNSQLYADESGVAVAGDNLPISLQIVVPSTATVSGKVILPDGSPAGGVVVYLDSNGVLSNTDGTFSLSGVAVRPSQSQIIYARTTDLTRQGQTTVVVNSATVPISGAIITLSGLGSAQFTVLDASGRPLSGQAVTLPDGFSGGCGSNSQTTNASGMVVFTGLPVGSVKAAALQSSGAGKDLAFGTATITQDGATGYAIVQFHGVGTVTGRVVDPNKTNPQPVLGAVIQLVSNVVDTQACTLAPAISQSVQTDASGNFRFNSVNVGPVAVTASQSFYPTQVGGKGTLSSNGATVNFPLLNSMSPGAASNR